MWENLDQDLRVSFAQIGKNYKVNRLEDLRLQCSIELPKELRDCTIPFRTHSLRCQLSARLTCRRAEAQEVCVG